MPMESYKHLYAKETLARWLADPQQDFIDFRNASGGGPFGRGVFVEYPFCLDDANKLHGETPWSEGYSHSFPWRGDNAPTYDECLQMGLVPIAIFDIAIHHKGFICDAFEIVHKHDLTDDKAMYIDRIKAETGLRAVYGLSADWILSQIKRPKKLKHLWTL